MLDVTSRRATVMRLADLALRDDLTGAANRPLLHDRLGLALAAAAREGSYVGVLYLDLDGFKPINDRYGHRAGDEVLVEIARRLATCVRTTDTVARIGGDEFAIVLPHLSDPNEAAEAAERARRAIAVPVHALGAEISVGASIGIATGVGTEDPHLLLHRADLAMYAGKPKLAAAGT